MVPAHRRRREPQLSNQQGVRDVRFQRRAYRSNTACRHEEHYRQEAHRAHGFEVAIDHRKAAPFASFEKRVCPSSRGTLLASPALDPVLPPSMVGMPDKEAS